MEERKQNPDQGKSTGSSITGPEHGQQGIDKAPGEEPSQDNVQLIQQSQKGKKVDADLSDKQERPLDKQDV